MITRIHHTAKEMQMVCEAAVRLLVQSANPFAVPLFKILNTAQAEVLMTSRRRALLTVSAKYQEVFETAWCEYQVKTIEAAPVTPVHHLLERVTSQQSEAAIKLDLLLEVVQKIDEERLETVIQQRYKGKDKPAVEKVPVEPVLSPVARELVKVSPAKRIAVIGMDINQKQRTDYSIRFHKQDGLLDVTFLETEVARALGKPKFDMVILAASTTDHAIQSQTKSWVEGHNHRIKHGEKNICQLLHEVARAKS